MHRIKIDENNPESDYERYLFDPKAELKDVPKFLKIKYPRDLSYDKQRPKYKRFMVMKTLKRPKTAAEKDSVIANAMLKDRFHEEGLVDPYNFAERSSKEFWSAGGGENYFKFDAWCGRERPPPHLILTEGEKALLSSTSSKTDTKNTESNKIKLSPIKKQDIINKRRSKKVTKSKANY